MARARGRRLVVDVGLHPELQPILEQARQACEREHGCRPRQFIFECVDGTEIVVPADVVADPNRQLDGEPFPEPE